MATTPSPASPRPLYSPFLKRMCSGLGLRRLPSFAELGSLRLLHWNHFPTRKPHNLTASAKVSSSPSSSSNSDRENVPLLPTSAYVHLPFCKKRCFYCDFAIVAVGERTSKGSPSDLHIDSTMESYVDLICTEIDASFKLWNPSSSYQTRPLKTLFFGGGTPSLVPAKHISRIIDAFNRLCGFENVAEISMEMDPGTFNRYELSAFLDCGVNRISLGIQAFQESFLRECGRSHGLGDVYEAIDLIHGCELKNWSLDLISSLPYQTIDLWEDSLREAIKASPAHLSVYDLQVEEGTKFGKWYEPGKFPLPDEGSSASFYKAASSLLREAGYEHYEISNYAKPGYECQHNLVYWKNMPYYAFGLGSTSYVHGHRFTRPRKWKGYAEYVKELEAMATQCHRYAPKCSGTEQKPQRLTKMGTQDHNLSSGFSGNYVEPMQDQGAISELEIQNYIQVDRDVIETNQGPNVAVVSGVHDSQSLSGSSSEMKDVDENHLEDLDTMILPLGDQHHSLLTKFSGNDSIETTIEDRLCDIIMLSLRLTQGVDLKEILETFGDELHLCLCEAFIPFVKSAHAEVLNKNREPISLELYGSLIAERSVARISEMVSFVRLTDPEGFLLSNEIISSLFSALPGTNPQNKL